MLGKDYPRLKDFKDACARSRTTLDPFSVISKVYTIAQIREIIKQLGMKMPEIPESRRSMSRRYVLAEAITDAYDADAIGATLSRVDHTFHFPVLTYLRIAEGEQYASVRGLLGYLDRQSHLSASKEFQILFNGLTQPPDRSCQLESIYVPDMDGDTVSLLFSCSRVLRVPQGAPDTHETLFLARIPAIARVLLRSRLVEIAIPTFAEPPAFSQSSSPKIPYRYQGVHWSARAQLANILPFKLRSIAFSKVSLYLETKEGAKDMGWMIEPQDQAAFDLKQGLIPLREIFDNFSQSIRSECNRRGLPYPLGDIDLYVLFRALKEQSYTYCFVLDVPLGPRGGNILIQTLYGRPDTQRDPVMLVQNHKANIADRLRRAIDQSQIADLENPYDLSRLFVDG